MAMLFPLVMPGLDPGIHQTKEHFSKTMDGRVKPGHDDRVRGGRAALARPLIAREHALHRACPALQLALARRRAHVRLEAVLEPPVVGEF